MELQRSELLNNNEYRRMELDQNQDQVGRPLLSLETRGLLLDAIQTYEPDFVQIQQYVWSQIGILNLPIDDSGSYIIHYLCRKNNAPTDLIRFCIEESNYTAIQLQDAYGRYPLHIVCDYNHSEEVILLLLAHFHEAIKVPDHSGRLPLHYICMKNYSEQFIRAIIDAYPLAIQKRDRTEDRYFDRTHDIDRFHDRHDRHSDRTHDRVLFDDSDFLLESGFYPLHYAYKQNYPTSVIRLLEGRTEPFEEGQILSFADEYPLHYACQNNDIGVVQNVIVQFPQAVQQRCRNGMYPLHYACKNSSNSSVIRLLFCKHPQALAQQCSTYRQYNPLHWICCNESISLELCIPRSRNSLLPIEMEAQLQRQSGGCTPLHLACSKKKCIRRFIDPLLEYLKSDDTRLHPITKPDKNGYLPLHLACEHEQSFEAIECLIKSHPEGVKHASNDGWFPLHMACAYGQSLSAIQLLVTEYPFALFYDVTIEDQKLNPLQLAKDAKSSQEIIQYLDDEMTLPREETSVLELEEAFKSDKPESVIQHLFRRNPITPQQHSAEFFNRLIITCKTSKYGSFILEQYKADPAAFEKTDERGFTVLHWLCYNKNKILDRIIQSQRLHKILSKMVLQQSNKGSTPLHIACSSNQSLDVIQYLLKYGESAIKMPNGDTCFPLHLACQCRQSDEVVELLLRQYPLAVKKLCSRGWLPLHYACESGKSDYVIRLLVLEYPYALLHRTKTGYLPIEVAHRELITLPFLQTKTSGIRFEIFEYLLKNDNLPKPAEEN